VPRDGEQSFAAYAWRFTWRYALFTCAVSLTDWGISTLYGPIWGFVCVLPLWIACYYFSRWLSRKLLRGGDDG
jgi:hypothetical protein